MRPDISQERIGVHPRDWKLDEWMEKMLKSVDPQIRPLVRIMCAGGFETFESCQGGKGHSYPEPTICFHGNKGEGFRAVAWLLSYGIEPNNVRRYWSVCDGEMHGPEWQVTFRFAA